MARGEQALEGKPEDLPSHFFPPNAIEDRVLWFKGLYLTIVNETTNDIKEHIDVDVAEEKHTPHKVPAGYTTYVRGANAYFEKSEDSAS